MLVPQLLPPRPPGAAPPRKAPGATGAPHHPAHDAASETQRSHAAHRAAETADDAAPFDFELARREQDFDLVAKLRAENEREANVLRDMAMAQLKKDDENLKKWIAMI
jgi:hypothetical protein